MREETSTATGLASFPSCSSCPIQSSHRALESGGILHWHTASELAIEVGPDKESYQKRTTLGDSTAKKICEWTVGGGSPLGESDKRLLSSAGPAFFFAASRLRVQFYCIVTAKR